MSDHFVAPAWVQCDGKERYPSRTVAERVARRRNASKRFKGQLTRPMAVYRCAHCGAHHIGGQSKP